MATFGSKHGKRETTFFMRNFPDGLNKEISSPVLAPTTLTRCKNMKYVFNQTQDGQKSVLMKKRQGTQLISLDDIGEAVKACTYYIYDAHYIVASDTEIFELDDATFIPSKIGDIDGVPTFTEFHEKLIIHDGGVTKAWDGTTFETLNNLITDEILSTGDGGTVIFSHSHVDHIPIKAGSFTITYTSGGILKTIVDDGDDTLSGDVDPGGTNTINYTTGAWAIKCSDVPDDQTTIYVTYEQAGGAPKSKAGFVRQSRLYTWGDEDNPSRMSYTAPNDEDAWDSSSNGGYLEVNKDDGSGITSCLNYFHSIVVVKNTSLHSITDYPGEITFASQPLVQELGSDAYRSCLSTNNSVTFISGKEGWLEMQPTANYGDISTSTPLSSRFRSEVVKYCNEYAYVEYNAIDNQLWLTLYNGKAQLPEIYVLNLETGAQLSMYQFLFKHSCYKFVNNEMLIGGEDGNLYRLFNENVKYTDNLLSYDGYTYIRGTMTNWAAPFNRKHNKRINVYIYGKAGTTATFNVYKDNDYATPCFTKQITLTGGALSIYWDGPEYLIHDMDFKIGSVIIAEKDSYIRTKFDYREVQFELTNIGGRAGTEFYGVDFVSALIGG